MSCSTNPSAIVEYLEDIERHVTQSVWRVRRPSLSIETRSFSNKTSRCDWIETSAKRRKLYRDNRDGWKDNVILSTSRSVSTFCNRMLLTNVTPLPDAMEYHENKATSLIQSCGLYMGIPVHYDPEGIVNEISMHQMIMNGGYCMKICRDGKVITATPKNRNENVLTFREQGGVYVLSRRHERTSKASTSDSGSD